MPVNAQAAQDVRARGMHRGPRGDCRCRRGHRRPTLLLIGDVQGAVGDYPRLALSSLADDDDGDLQKPPAGVAFMSRLADKEHASPPIGRGPRSFVHGERASARLPLLN